MVPRPKHPVYITFVIILGVIVIANLVLLVKFVSFGHTMAILDPKGPIATQERDLIYTATFLMLLIVVPTFILTGAIAWRYRAGNHHAKYTPEWDHNLTEEFIWWAVPSVIVAALAGYAWTSSHDLDPFKPLVSESPPIVIQVVALDWKWLFIYPKEGIASVNTLEFPVNTPVEFRITADAPMNSFWIPQLGGQIYAMAGMTTRLHLMADVPGTYSGSSANFSGAGFAGMRFTAVATSPEEFDNWIASVRTASSSLSLSSYDALARPSHDVPVTYYSSVDPELYTTIVSSFMTPRGSETSMPGMLMLK